MALKLGSFEILEASQFFDFFSRFLKNYQRHIFKIEAANNVKSSFWRCSVHLLTIFRDDYDYPKVHERQRHFYCPNGNGSDTWRSGQAVISSGTFYKNSTRRCHILHFCERLVDNCLWEHSYMTSDVFWAFLTYLPTLIRYFTT